ncbi:hypothetical protein GUITHDRAFT_108155 [Guillardia theta CCMP2712]|uniref:Uncharacterized protein n=1 Tax=Guillardia theta (strain CCMP2712) TaxID=905079 RepID=L1JC72_GUITC|nr:hypothetical protein GUITHDRAFT_108155 [Guillardia theta CCMP2712]EKX46121.1 hypothetical protein GUITHDRAFT_108155 [Guillardia theta CCMP2712]|eukprot:XP_005833101.1 hypothetical protein GUITHDRAFT_108155 [Guillardia theta CCMP2712]
MDPFVNLKIVSIFTVLATSIIGVMLPVLRWRKEGPKTAEEPSFWFFLLRAYAAGVMLALAFVHIISDAFSVMDGLTGNFPIASVLVMVGVMLMMLVERASLDFGSRCFGSSGDAARVCCHSDVHQHSHGCLRHAHQSNDCHHEDAEEIFVIESHALPPHVPHAVADEELGTSVPPSLEALKAADLPQVSGDAQGDLADVVDAKPRVMLGMLEFGIVVHSVIIGMDLGVRTQKPSAIVGLMIALCFHQFFEGLGLGSCIAYVMHEHGSAMQWPKIMLMVMLFSITFPLGVALGMISIAAQSFHAQDLFHPWLQGTLDALSGGILVHLAFIHFISEDFSRTDINSPKHLRLRWSMLLSVILGATCMSLLALQA